jgi:site-specific recombinase XerC
MTSELMPMSVAAARSVSLRPTMRVPALVTAAGERAGMRFLEFFAANIRNPHTRRAYARAADEFLGWCASVGVPSIAAVQPVHVATWIEAGTRELAAPSVKQRLAAIRHLFDWLVTGQVVPVNHGRIGARAPARRDVGANAGA